MRVSDLTRPKLAHAVVDVDGEIVNVTFDRNKVTLAWAKEAQRAESEGDADAIAQSLSDLIHGWDLTNDDGSPHPPTAANLAALPVELLKLVGDEIQNASVPSRAEGNGSSVPPSTPPLDSEALAQTAQNGAVTSPSPTGSAAPSLR